MLNPVVRMSCVGTTIVADFWDSLRLDPAPIRDLRLRYDTCVANGEGPNLLIDLTGVTFAGSAALSGFVTLQKSCRKAGGRMIFCQVEPSVLESFRVSRLLPLFTLIAHREDALATLAGRELVSPAVEVALDSPERESVAVPPIRSRRRRV